MASTAAAHAGTSLGRAIKRELPSVWHSVAALALVVFALAASVAIWPPSPACDDTGGCVHLADTRSPAGDTLALLSPTAESDGEESFGPADDEPVVSVTADGRATFSGRPAFPQHLVLRGARHELFPDKTGPPHA
jgi:hypothetical protein